MANVKSIITNLNGNVIINNDSDNGARLQVTGNGTISGDWNASGYVTANGEGLAASLRVGGIYGDLGLYVPSTYDMQFDLGWNGSFKFTRANVDRFRIDSSGVLFSNSGYLAYGDGTFTYLYAPDANGGITMGDATAPVNVYYNDTHTFQSAGQLANYGGFTSTGFGVGTVAPSSKLEVVKQGNASGGTMLLSGSKTNNAVKYGIIATSQYASDTETEGVGLIGGVNTSTENIVVVGGGIDEINTATSIRFYTAANTTTRGSANERMRVNEYGQLLINAASSAYSALNYGYNLGVRGTSSQAFISIAKSNQTLDSEGLIVGIDDTTGYVWVRDNINLTFGTNNSAKVTVAAGGNFLIGTTTDAGYKLAVNGKAVFGTGQSLEIGNAALNPVDSGISYGIFHQSGVGLGIVSGAGGTTQGIDFWSNDGTNFFQSMRISGGNGNVGIGTTSPGAKLTIGTSFATTNGFTIDTADSSHSQIIARKTSSKTAFGLLAWDTSVFLSAGIYYEGGTWVQNNHNGTNQLFNLTPGSGARWYASNNGSGSWNVSSDVQLWDDAAIWTSLVRSTRAGDSYFTGGNVGIGTTSPADLLTLYSTNSSIISLRDAGVNANYGGYIKGYGISGSGGYIDIGVIDNNTKVAGITMAPQLTYMTFKTGASATEAMRIPNTQNVLIGTTTDSGYKLDVNGTFRSQGVLNVQNGYYENVLLNIAGNTTKYLYVDIINSYGNVEVLVAGYASSGTGSCVIKWVDGGHPGGTDYHRILQVARQTQGNPVLGSLIKTSSGAAISIQNTSAQALALYITIQSYGSNAGKAAASLSDTAPTGIDSSILNVDDLNNRVGITTKSPITKLSLGGYNGARLPYIDATTKTFDAAGITVPSSNNANAGIGGGIDLTNNTYSVGAYSPIISFSSLSSNSAYNNSYAGIWGVLGGQGVDANWVVGHLAFGTGNGAGISERMRIVSNGNVLIGTTNDLGTKLNVNGTSYISGAASFGSTIDVNGNVTLTQDTNDLIFQQTNSSTHGIVWKNTTYAKDSASIRPTGNGAWATQGIGFYTGAAGDSTTAPSLRFNIEAGGSASFTNGGGNTSISNSNDYSLQVTQSASNAGQTFNEALFLLNSNQNDSNFVAIGMSTNGTDGQHHRVSLRALRDGSVGGQFQMALREAGTANNVVRVNVKSNGNFLIGTTTDSGYKLDVNGTSLIRGNFYTAGELGIELSWTGNTLNDSRQGRIRPISTPAQNPYAGGLAFDYYKYDGSAYNWFEGMRLNGSGNVGIGTTSPTLGLHVGDGKGLIVGGSGFTGSMYVSPQDENTINGGYGITADDGDLWLNYRGYQDGWSYFRDTRIGNGKGTAITYWNGDTGNMMIGTTTDSGYKLEVNGSFYSTSGVIQTATNASEVLVLRNSGGNSGSVQGITHLGINFFSVGTNSPVRITAYQNGTSGYAGGMYFSTRSANSDSAPVEAMRITHDQLIGLGPVSSFTTTHRVWIDKGSSTYAVYSQGSIQVNAGAIGVGVTPSATTGRIDAGNDIVAYSTSDSRLKENITPIANALDKVKSLTGVEFDWKEETKDVHGYEGHDVGVIAQEVQAVLPEAIRTNDTGYLSVRYEKMIALLIEANKELASRVEELEKKLK